MNGLQLASLYSFGCNKTKKLRVDAFLWKAVKKQVDQKELRKVLKQLIPYFYYRLLAMENQVKDCFDASIVRAYWLGGEFLKSARQKNVMRLVREKNADFFHNGLGFTFIPLLKEQILLHHNWTIFLLQNKKTPGIAEKLDSCKVSVGLVEKIWTATGKACVEYQKLKIKDGCYVLEIEEAIINKGFLGKVKGGDLVTFHVGIGREVVNQQTAEDIEQITQGAVEFFNKRK